MSDYKSLLAHVSDSEHSVAVLKLAARLASEHGASVRAVHAVEPLHLGAHLGPEAAMIAAQTRQHAQRERTSGAQQRVVDAARTSGVEIDFDSSGGDPVAAMSVASRTADLMLVAQPSTGDADNLSRRFESQLLVGAGCPVLFVPTAGSVDSFGKRVLVAWTATRESARAVRDAMPLLKRALTVEVLRLGTTASGSNEPLDAVAAYLSTHGVAANCSVKPVRHLSIGERMLTPAVVDASIAELLLSHTADIDADLIVMGGYGHTRAYELVLGGVTRTMLASMTVPVLMSH